MMTMIALQLPDEIHEKLGMAGRSPAETVRVAAAFFLCQRGELSTSQAFALAGLPYADFLAAAAAEKVELFPMTMDELREQISHGYTLGGRKEGMYLSDKLLSQALAQVGE